MDYTQAQDGTIIRDFMQRTLQNLHFIESHVSRIGYADVPQVYEVTQLINSMLGLLVFPREEFWQYLSELPLESLPERFPTLRGQKWRMRPIPTETSEFQTLIRLLRNSVAHFGIQTNSRTGMIEALILSNRNRGQINWQILIPIHELREFVEWFARGIIDSSLLDRPIEEIKVA